MFSAGITLAGINLHKINFRYYYDHKTGVSTWDKPATLAHVDFEKPGQAKRKSDNKVGKGEKESFCMEEKDRANQRQKQKYIVRG